MVKALPRLGGHRTLIDYLQERGVRGLMNDDYARDIGNKIRAGYRQKQKEGIVITPLRLLEGSEYR